MNSSLMKQVKDDIQVAYQAKDVTRMEKETLYVFDRTVHFMLSTCTDQLKGITFETNVFDIDNAYILSEDNLKTLHHMLDSITHLQPPLSDSTFGKLKVDIERWHYRMGGTGIRFDYWEGYLLTRKEAAEELGVSNTTLNKYIKKGLETADTTSPQHIPKHVVPLWKDPVYGMRMQMVAQKKKLQSQTGEERLQEIRDNILTFQKAYQAKTITDALSKNNIEDINSLKGPSDLQKWNYLEKEKGKLLDDIIEESKRVEQPWKDKGNP